MYFTRATALALAALATQVAAHGVVTSITGANGVTMPGLSVADGTPRDCATPGCGAEADTSIIRKNDANPLGKTNGGGPVDAAAAIAKFMGTSSAGSSTSSTGSNDEATTATDKKKNTGLVKRGLLGNLLGGGNDGGAAGGAGGSGAATAQGTKTPKGTTEGGVSKAAGTGATAGLPTADENGIISMNFHQVNQDGAGPLSAAIDPTSGGQDESAFQPAQMIQDVPGAGIGGLSGATTTDFPIKVQMPAGMKCAGSAGGAQNVCILKVQNQALAGPFGGSAAFTNGGASAAGNTTNPAPSSSASASTGAAGEKRYIGAKFRA